MIDGDIEFVMGIDQSTFQDADSKQPLLELLDARDRGVPSSIPLAAHRSGRFLA